MKKWVEEKLHIIGDLYPDDRIERSKRRLRKLWAGEMPEDRYPFLYSPLTFNYYDEVHLPEQRLRLSLDEHIARGRIEDDFIPALFPGCRQGTIPSMFGAKEIVVDGNYSSARLIYDLKDIDALPEPSIGPGTVAHEWLEMQRYFFEETEGRLPINVVDMQGPVEVCAKLWGHEDFFLATYTDPGHCHRLMDRLTDAFILFWEAQRKLLGGNFVGTHLWGWNWVPENSGATISSDGVVMVSPDFYDEFYNPSTIKIGEHFGGVTIHSCGDFSAVLKNMIAPGCVRGIHAGQMNIRGIIKAGLTRNVVCTAGSSMKEIEADFLAAKEYRLLCNPTIANFWPENPPGVWTEHQWRDIQYLHEHVVEWASIR